MSEGMSIVEFSHKMSQITAQRVKELQKVIDVYSMYPECRLKSIKLKWFDDMQKTNIKFFKASMEKLVKYGVIDENESNNETDWLLRQARGIGQLVSGEFRE